MLLRLLNPDLIVDYWKPFKISECFRINKCSGKIVSYHTMSHDDLLLGTNTKNYKESPRNECFEQCKELAPS